MIVTAIFLHDTAWDVVIYKCSACLEVEVIILDDDQGVPDAVVTFEEVRRAHALQTTVGHYGDSIAKNICLVHEMRGQDH